MKKDKIINLILIFVFVLTLGVILFLTKSKTFNKDTTPTNEEVKINEGFKKVEIKDLKNRLNALNFAFKKQDYYNKTTIATVNAIIADGKVSITIKSGATKRAYSVMDIDNAVSVLTNVNITNGGTHISYILTEDGRVFKIEDKIKEVKESADYVGKANDLGLTNITSMAIDKNLKFKLGDGDAVEPCVYMKSDDGRYFTDEKIVSNEEVIELVEKEEKTEEKKEENTSSES